MNSIIDKYNKTIRHEVNCIQRKLFPNHQLDFICGGGEFNKPKVMFVFINPTHANISTSKDWKGIKAPFIGTKNIWRIFNKAGLFSDDLMLKVENTKTWSEKFAEDVYSHLAQKRLFFTNIVKFTGHNADLPNIELIKMFLPTLKKEIELVDPEYIITFGLIPFNHITGKDIKMGDVYNYSLAHGSLKTFDTEIMGKTRKVVPIYFPIWRGNPKRAVDMLKLLQI